MRRWLAVASVALVLAPPAVYAIGEAIAEEGGITGKVLSVFGNRFVMEAGDQKLLVDTGPTWHRSLELDVGETVTVTGADDYGQFEALTLKRGEAVATTIRPAGDDPPWAGKRGGWFGKMRHAAFGDTETLTEFEGVVSDVFGNTIIVDGEGQSVLVDAGPAWYQRFDFKPGEKLRVTGVVSDDSMDAVTIARDGGKVDRVRPASGKPPWAGKKGMLVSFLW